MVLQVMALSETVVVLLIHQACDTDVKLPLIQQIGDYAQTVILSCLKLILSTFIERTKTLVFV